MATGSFFTKETAGLPNWAWGAVVLVGVGVGVVFMKLNKPSTSTPATGTTSTGQTGPSEAAANVDSQSGQVPIYIVTNPGSDQSSTPTTTTPTPPPTTTPAPPTYVVRASGKAPGYDSKNTGVPLRSSPGGSTVTTVPFGATITSPGQPVYGPENLKNGSTLWYPAVYNGQAGYISAWDLMLSGSDNSRANYPTNVLAQ